MIKQLSDFIQQFPMSDDKQSEKQFYLIKDTYDISGNFIINSFLNFLLKNNKKIFFLSLTQTYAHYVSVSKKLGLNIETYIKNK